MQSRTTPFFQDKHFTWEGLLSRQLIPPYIPKRELTCRCCVEMAEEPQITQLADSVTADDIPESDWVDPDPSVDCRLLRSSFGLTLSTHKGFLASVTEPPMYGRS